MLAVQRTSRYVVIGYWRLRVVCTNSSCDDHDCVSDRRGSFGRHGDTRSRSRFLALPASTLALETKNSPPLRVVAEGNRGAGPVIDFFACRR